MITINPMTKEYTSAVIDMMRVFYASPAVSTNGSEEIFQNDVEQCINDSPYLEGYVFIDGDNGNVAGYAMIAKSFSTEFGRQCIWIEDLYIKPEYRGTGIGTNFLSFIKQKYSDSILRLEVEEENEHAVHVYRKSGFQVLPYMEMKK